MDVKRRPSSRIAPRSGAIAYGIEGSKVVLAALERTKSEDDIAFLKTVVDNATALLCAIREIREGEVDDGFASLALDACGLAFVLINECDRCRRDHNPIPDKLKWGSNELAEYLRDDVHPFVQKKISRGFLKRHLKHASDDEKIMKFREKLKIWMGKLGIQTDLSIHEKVEAIISERMSAQEGAQAGIVNVVNAHSSQLNTTEALQNPASNSKPFNPVGDGKRSTEKPLPQIIVSDSRDDEEPTGPTGDPDSNHNRKPSNPSPAEAEERKKRKEEERLAKKAERERWRRSEQEFSLLPLQETTAPARPETSSRPASVSSFRSQAHSLESVRSLVAGLTSKSEYDEVTDREMALQLQAQLAREIEEEDEKKALEIGIALHHQWEAEKDAKTEHLGSNVQLRTPDSMDSRSLKPEIRNTLSPRKQADQNQNRLPRSNGSMGPDMKRSASPIQPTFRYNS